jgi:DNA invertase Pin-like site-specific DNA recombinase
VLYSVKEGYAFENNMTSKIMGFAFGIAAEIERNLIAARTKEALAYRKTQGMILGRPKGSNVRTQVLQGNAGSILKMLDQGKPKTEIARIYGVSKTTLYNFLKRELKEKGTFQRE